MKRKHECRWDLIAHNTELCRKCGLLRSPLLATVEQRLRALTRDTIIDRDKDRIDGDVGL